jgi:hypothetical protein
VCATVDNISQTGDIEFTPMGKHFDQNSDIFFICINKVVKKENICVKKM